MADIRYTKDHEWVRMEDDGTATVGITDHAQEALGDIVFVELPVVESVKAASDIYAPMAGKVLEVNELLTDDPSLVNRDPEDEAWFFRMEPSDADAFAALMDEDGYASFVESL